MISLVFKHPFETLGFCARAIEKVLGLHILSMYLSLFTFWLDDKSSFKHPSEALGFCVRMIEWTLESYKLFILSFPSPFLIRWWTSFFQKTQSLQTSIKRKVLGLQPSPSHIHHVCISFHMPCSIFYSHMLCSIFLHCVLISLIYIVRMVKGLINKSHFQVNPSNRNEGQPKG